MAMTLRAPIIMRTILMNTHRTRNRTIVTQVASANLDLQKNLTTDTASGTFKVKWDVAEEVIQKSDITGAILPFSELNIVQKIFAPYTYPIMYSLDFLSCQMPWWLAIIGTTAVCRLITFPLVLKHNKIGIKSQNILPQTQQLQAKVNEALCSGNSYQAAVNKTKLKLLYDQHGLGPSKKIMPVLAQAPMFFSMFLLLRRLAAEELPGLTTGGAFWFTNLTVADPFYILPIMTSASMFLLLRFGLEGTAGQAAGMGPAGRWIARAFPVGLLAITYNFPAAVLLYWCTSNIFTVSYAMLLKLPRVKKMFNIPALVEHPPESLPLTNQSFSSQWKSAVDQSKQKRTTMDVRRLDDIAFRKAGIGPLKKTYKEPPVRSDAQ